MTTDIGIVLGTRPEIIKLSPVIQECKRLDCSYQVIHTGQHYSDRLDGTFFDQLELPAPDHNLGVGSDHQGQQTAEMLAGIEEVLLDIEPETVLVQGDTNSVLAGAIATSKLDVELAHVEAGLRSYDRDMPEESNRVVTDHVADYLFPPTEDSEENLLEEGIPPSRILVTGNTVVDALTRHLELARKHSDVLTDCGLADEEYIVLTAHRAENVDDERRFRQLLSGVERAAKAFDVDVVYPIHPRAAERLEQFEIDVPDRICVLDPLGYLDFLRLEAAAALVVTDSGGVQEEACILGVPCVTVRDSTERPETVSAGANWLAGCDPQTIERGVEKMLETSTDWLNPFGDGTASHRIMQQIAPEATEDHQ